MRHVRKAGHPEDVQTDFVRWARQSLHRVSDANLDAPTSDLRPMREMIGAAKIVGLSEGQHAAAEPLVFRNRLFKYLVENLGFGAMLDIELEWNQCTSSQLV